MSFLIYRTHAVPYALLMPGCAQRPRYCPHDFLVLTQGHTGQADVLLRPPSAPNAPPS